MPMSYQILKDQRLVIVTTSGVIDLCEAIQFLDRMFNDPEYSLDDDLLWDDTERTSIFTYDDVRQMAQHFKYYKGDNPPKRAFVVSRSVKYGVTSVFSTLESIKTHAQIGIFQDIKGALKWLKH